MGDNVNPVDEAKESRWRPAVAPFRPRAALTIRSGRPLPGQMVLPGIEAGEGLPQTDEPAGNESHTSYATKVPSGGSRMKALERAPACPNCGATDFDEDGDCTSCWEPSVVGDSPE